MSLIYEALQRAEAERAGNAAAPSADATELLKRAEHRARVQRNAELSADSSTLPHTSEDRAVNNSRGLFAEVDQAHQTDAELCALGQVSPGDFETVHLSPPFHSRLVALADNESPAAEAFRLLGVRLRHMRRERPLKRLLICSTVTQEGKSMISVNLACTIAAGSRQNVLLIDGDIRRPSLTEIFGIGRHPGLCEYLSGERGLSESIYRLEEAHLWLMPAGSSRDDQTELLHSDPLPGMLQQLDESFHWIIIDSPPVLPLADTSIWSRLVDSILLVARNSTTQKEKLKRGLEALDSDKLIGAVLNSATTSSEYDYYYYRSSSEPPNELGEN